MTNEPHFTAEVIARCLECRPQNVRKILKGRIRDATEFVRGIESAAWYYSSLPFPILDKLAKLATIRGYSTPLRFLQNPPARGPKTRCLKGIAPKVISRCQKEMQVFESFAHLPAETPDTERARIALLQWQRVFGYSVSDRYIRREIARVRENAGGSLKLGRLEFFLPKHPPRNRCRTRLDDVFQFEELDDA